MISPAFIILLSRTPTLLDFISVTVAISARVMPVLEPASASKINRRSSDFRTSDQAHSVGTDRD